MQREHAAIVYNPVAGGLDQIGRAVEAEERRHGWEQSRWFPTGRDDLGRSAAEDALQGKPSVVAVAGGDGTVRTVADVFHESGTPLALLPSGTGNLLARNLGLPLGDIDSSVNTAFGRGVHHIDIGVADLENDSGQRNRHVFLVMAGIGLDAQMAQNTSALAKKHIGWLAYVAPIARSIIANRHFHLRYRIDGGHTRSAHAHTVIVGNCGTLTGNMLLLPDAVVDDGLLDVVMLRPQSRFGWARIGTRLTIQKLVNRSRLGKRMLRLAPAFQPLAYAQGHQFDVRFDTPREVELDGDSFGRITRARITVRPSALAVRVPDDEDAKSPSLRG